MIISKMISKVFKTKIENSDSISIPKNNFAKKDNQDFENNKKQLFARNQSSIRKTFQYFFY